MLKCRVCGYKSSNKTMMQNHISSAHRSTVIRDSSLSRNEECTVFSSATLSAFIDSDSSVNDESFSGGSGTFGGGGASGSWDDSSSSSSSSSDSESSSDSSCSGD